MPILLSPGIVDAAPAVWDEQELAGLRLGELPPPMDVNAPIVSKYTPTPGTGSTGITPIAPSPYAFYSPEEVYVPAMQADGGQLSEWSKTYAPTKEQAEEDRQAAYAANVPHGYVAPGSLAAYDGPLLTLWVVSELHEPHEYGSMVDEETGMNSGGPFQIQVSPKIRVEQLRIIIRDEGGVIPALQRLSFAGKHMEDSQRTLEHYGVAYWHQRFPHWPLKIRKY